MPATTVTVTGGIAAVSVDVSRGLTGVPGSEANITNANVNTALETDPDASRTALGLGTLSTQSGTFSGDSSGTNTGDQDLSTLMVKANNLSDLTNATTARTNLGLGTAATTASTAYDPAGSADAAAAGIISNYIAPLSVPTGDVSPKVTHPSVVNIEAGFAGYTHWMAYTPFPDASREDPQFSCSKNGVKWVTHPDAANSRILPNGWKTAQSPVVGWCADTHIIQLANGSLAVYFIAARSSGGGYLADVWRTTTTDGATWTAPVKVLTGDAVESGAWVTSPCVEYAADGTTMYMWTTNDRGKIGGGGATEAGIARRTSTDNGLTWSTKTLCTFPRHCHGHTTVDNFVPWHCDVKRTGSTWHMLMNSSSASAQNSGRVFYLTSTDGLAWLGDVVEPCTPLLWSEVPEFAINGSGANAGMKIEFNYRSCFLPVPGQPLSWRIWLTSGGDDITLPTTNNNVTWTIALLENVVLNRYRKPITAEQRSLIERHTDRYVMTPNSWRMIGSAASPAVINATTYSTLVLTLAAAAGSSGLAVPYASGSGYAPSYVAPGESRTALDWRNKYRIEASFMVTTDATEFFFLLGVKNTYTNATGFVGRMCGFGIKNGSLYAVANTASAGDNISIASGQLVAPLIRGGGSAIGYRHHVSMTINADGSAEFLINGLAFRVATGMPAATASSFADDGSILPGIFIKQKAEWVSGGEILYVNKFDVSLLYDSYGGTVVPINRLQ